MEMLTARELGNRLGSSARPIFTAFKDMDELKGEVVKAANLFLDDYVKRSMAFVPAFKQAGLMMVHFAIDEPRIFQLLLMTCRGDPPDFDTLYADNGGEGTSTGGFQRFVQCQYGLDAEQARMLFKHVWLHTYALSVLSATGMCRFTEDELVDLLGEEFKAMMMFVKSDLMGRPTEVPVPVPPKEGKAIATDQVNGYDLVNTLLPAHTDLPRHDAPWNEPDFSGYTAQELSDLISLHDYQVPLWGELLATGDETPAWPYAFAAIGALALVALAILRRRKAN